VNSVFKKKKQQTAQQPLTVPNSKLTVISWKRGK